jgi:hypothetical protein
MEPNLSSECNNFPAIEAIPGIDGAHMYSYLFSQEPIACSSRGKKK